MLRCIFFLTALIALPAFAQSEVPAAQPDAAAQVEPAQQPAPVPAATAVAAPQLTPEQQLEQFRHDEINLLALRADAHSLLAAALMAQSDTHDKSRPTALKSPALLKRAQESGVDDALVWWVSANIECRDAAKACPGEETMRKLESVDAENAAVWALSLHHAQQAKDEVTARAALTSAAQATRYNDYFGATVAILDDSAAILPMSAELLTASRQEASVAGYRLTSSAVIAAALSSSVTAAITDACKVGTQEATLAIDCTAIAQKMAASGSIGAQHFGLSLLESLLPPGPEIDTEHIQARKLAWQTQRIGELAGRLVNDSRITRIYNDALSESGDETAAVSAVLRSQGVPLEPPAGWQPPQTEVPAKP